MNKKIKIGIIGLGQRGYNLLSNFFVRSSRVEVTALSDIYADRTQDAYQKVLETAGNKPVTSTNYLDILDPKLVDAVIIATSWDTHIEVAIEAMKRGIITGLEVGGAYSIEECWDLVKTFESTQTPFMFLENCCYNKDELLATALVRHGILGEIVHASGSYTHDIRDEVAYGIEKRHYRLLNYINRNGDNYPTHELGPIAKILGVNRGNRMVSLVSMASKAKGMEQYIHNNLDTINPKLHDQRFNQGDVVYTLIKCANGETITLKLDTTLPSYPGRNFTIKGTKGMYQQPGNIVVVDGVDNKEEIWGEMVNLRRLLDNADRYKNDYLPDYWKNITPEQISAGHGGMDVYMLDSFLDAIEQKDEMPIDVYDAAAWMAITILSEESINLGSQPVAIPDFTKGKWIKRPLKDVVKL